jgi:dCMP deaminase
MKPSNKWDRRFLDLAHLVSTWSKDTSTQVGAVIVNNTQRIVSVGYNGPPRETNDGEAVMGDRDERLRRTIHAEVNAVLFSQGSLEGCSLYCTHPPCARCMSVVIQMGIRRVVCRPPTAEFRARWKEDFDTSRFMADESGTHYVWVPDEA